MIPDGIVFKSDPKYEDRCRSFSDLLEALPSIDGWKPSSRPPDLNDLAQSRLDAREIGEIGAEVSVEMVDSVFNVLALKNGSSEAIEAV